MLPESRDRLRADVGPSRKRTQNANTAAPSSRASTALTRAGPAELPSARRGTYSMCTRPTKAPFRLSSVR